VLIVWGASLLALFLVCQGSNTPDESSQGHTVPGIASLFDLEKPAGHVEALNGNPSTACILALMNKAPLPPTGAGHRLPGSEEIEADSNATTIPTPSTGWLFARRMTGHPRAPSSL